MKKYITTRISLILLMTVLTFSLSACSLLGLSDGKALDDIYMTAFDNSMELIPELFPEKVINSSMANARYLNDSEIKSVTLFEEYQDYFETHEQQRCWVLTIGNSSGYDYVQMICDSQTDEVIGYIDLQ